MPRAPSPPADDPVDLSTTLGANLRRIRTERGLSLERFARLSGVSRAMLGQIELGQSAPTINVVWRITQALNLPFSALIAEPATSDARVLRGAQAKRLLSSDGTFSSRALFPHDERRKVEFYEIRILPGGREHADPHPPGTTENLVCTAGAVEVETGGTRHQLQVGDAMMFRADTAHVYRNPGATEAVLYMVVSYA